MSAERLKRAHETLWSESNELTNERFARHGMDSLDVREFYERASMTWMRNVLGGYTKPDITAFVMAAFVIGLIVGSGEDRHELESSDA